MVLDPVRAPTSKSISVLPHYSIGPVLWMHNPLPYALQKCLQYRCLWRFTADSLQCVQDNPDWECPCCRPPPALALQYPPQPLPRQRTSLQLGAPDRTLRTGGSFSGRSVEGVKRRPSQSGASSPTRRVSASAEVNNALLCGPL